MSDFKIGDTVKTTEKYNKKLTPLHHWCKIVEGEIVSFDFSGNIAKIKLIKSSNRNKYIYFGISHIEKIK